MKKIIALLSILLGFQSFGIAQNSRTERLWHDLAIAQKDTGKVQILSALSDLYKLASPDSSIFYGNKAVELARQISFPNGVVEAMSSMAIAQNSMGNHEGSLKIILQALKIAEKNDLILLKAKLLIIKGRIYILSMNYEEALRYLKHSNLLFDSLKNNFYCAIVRGTLGEAFLKKSQLDSALYYAQSANELAIKVHNTNIQYLVLPVLGQIYQKKGNTNLALSSYQLALQIDNKDNLYVNPNLLIARLYHDIHQQDSSIYYAQKSLEIAYGNGFLSSIIDANLFLSEIYEKSNPQKALQYNKSAVAYMDSLKILRNATAMKTFTEFDAQERQYEIEQAQLVYKSRIQRLWIFSITGALLSALFVAFILLRNNKTKQKANALLKEQKEEIQTTLEQLRSTQAQLIQSEKMASLGELTAGIAHEIQNPLNFVNNFSDVSEELVIELKEELNKGDLEEAKVISDDVIQNLKKIKHHGQRASDIVKGMLQHSRSSSGVKEPTDINALADEYLRLAYHGLRAKDKSFNADFKTDFDPKLPKIYVIPQDIGRVLLNLINNAFYAVDKRAKEENSLPPAGSSEESKRYYKPIVTVSTSSSKSPLGDLGVKVVVKDNGNGIPASIVDKIFQPFFTTKPTGQGTGLGLSLSYDIIKAHGGELKVETKEEEGTEFIIHLPIKT